jgi:hypothetical protein
MIGFEQILCHPAESNCGHTDFQSVALPTELGWQYELKNDFIVRISFQNPFGEHSAILSNLSRSIIRQDVLTANHMRRREFNAPWRFCQQLIRTNFFVSMIVNITLSF